MLFTKGVYLNIIYTPASRCEVCSRKSSISKLSLKKHYIIKILINTRYYLYIISNVIK